MFFNIYTCPEWIFPVKVCCDWILSACDWSVLSSLAIMRTLSLNWEEICYLARKSKVLGLPKLTIPLLSSFLVNTLEFVFQIISNTSNSSQPSNWRWESLEAGFTRTDLMWWMSFGSSWFNFFNLFILNRSFKVLAWEALLILVLLESDFEDPFPKFLLFIKRIDKNEIVTKSRRFFLFLTFAHIIRINMPRDWFKIHNNIKSHNL